VKPRGEASTAAPAEIRRGLTSSEATSRLGRDGPNILPVSPPPPAWRLLAAQMVHFFAILLWFAGGLAFVARLPELGIAIFIVVMINGLFAFVQEYRAERAAERLRDLLPRSATVLRDGRPVEVEASELVVGDVVLLSSGDRISADLRVMEAHSLSVDTSTLTGERVPVSVEPEGTAFAGTFVVEGEGLAVVTATGSDTRLARIAVSGRCQEALDPGVVDGAVESAEALHAPADQRLDLPRDRHVGPYEGGRPARLLDQAHRLLTAFGRDIRDDDRCSLFGELSCAGAPDARGGARYQRHLAAKSLLRHVLVPPSLTIARGR
jgi:magnesium-transporting ATPase (P-type)